MTFLLGSGRSRLLLAAGAVALMLTAIVGSIVLQNRGYVAAVERSQASTPVTGPDTQAGLADLRTAGLSEPARGWHVRRLTLSGLHADFRRNTKLSAELDVPRRWRRYERAYGEHWAAGEQAFALELQLAAHVIGLLGPHPDAARFRAAAADPEYRRLVADVEQAWKRFDQTAAAVQREVPSFAWPAGETLALGAMSWERQRFVPHPSGEPRLRAGG